MPLFTVLIRFRINQQSVNYWLLIPIILGLIFFAFAFTFLYIFKLPKVNPTNFKQEEGKKTLLFVGDSLTHGTMSSNFVKSVEQFFGNEDYQYVNAGYNGYLTIDILGRIEPIVNCQPDVVFILLGANDVNGCLPDRAKLYTNTKYFPKDVEFWNINRFKQDYSRIIETLQEQTDAKIVLMTLPPIGEKPDHEVYKLALEYSMAIEELGKSYNLPVLPIFQLMHEYLEDRPTENTLDFHKGLPLMWLTSFTHYLLRRDWDKISEKNNFKLFVDHIHLNNTGADIIAEEIVGYLRSASI